MFNFVFVIALSALTAVAAVEVQIESDVFSSLRKSATVDLLVSFRDADVLRIIGDYESSFSLMERSSKSNADVLPDRLKLHAAESQSRVLKALDGLKSGKSKNTLEVTQLWISNQLFIQNANRQVIRTLAGMREISKIEKNPVYNMFDTWGNETARGDTTTSRQAGEIAWGVRDIEAPVAWERGDTGEGAVVGIIDTGVRASHEALKDNYRKEFGWFDATAPIPFPYDNQGHGTHCAGSAVGRNGIGVAPGAKWIACKALAGIGSVTGASIYLCGQWMLCPTDPLRGVNCSMRPDVVSNSWGFTNPLQQIDYSPIIEGWRAAGIIGLFANGNSGYAQCATTVAPAGYPRTIGIGATNSDNKVTQFSSRGPSLVGGVLKPDLSAPGADIWSASRKGDGEYEKMSGTSMATPHVAGLVALMRARNKTMTHEDVLAAMIKGAVDVVPSAIIPCGTKRDETRPNNYVGHGKVNVPRTLYGTNGTTTEGQQ